MLLHTQNCRLSRIFVSRRCIQLSVDFINKDTSRKIFRLFLRSRVPRKKTENAKVQTPEAITGVTNDSQVPPDCTSHSRVQKTILALKNCAI